MIPTKKLTPLSCGYRITSRRPPQPELAVIMRARLQLDPKRPLELVRRQIHDATNDPVQDAAKVALDEAAYILGQGQLGPDLFEDKDTDRLGQLVYPSDFAEYKPKTDVMLRGSCHPPGGSATECTVGFGVGSFYKELVVRGPRAWVDRVLGGEATQPLAFKKLPVDYEHAYGGPGVPGNPVGKGHESDETRQLPCVEHPKHGVTRSGQEPRPEGFGPINPGWPLRRDKWGKEYGPEWERTRAPWHSADYDWTAQNAAPVDQQLEGYLRGDETVRLVNLHPQARDLSLPLPGLRPRAFVMLDGGASVEVTMNLDTLFADLEKEELFLTWRGHTPVKEDDLSDVRFLLVAHELLADKKKPAKDYLEQLQAFADDPIGLKDNPASALADLDDKIESGALDRELDTLDAEGSVEHVFGPVLARSEGGDEQLAGLKGAVRQSVGDDPARQDAFKQSLKASLKASADGPPAPLISFTPKGEVLATPFLRKISAAASVTKRAMVAQGQDPTPVDTQVAKVLALVPGGATELPEPIGPPPDPRPGADFGGHDLSGRDLSGLDLAGCNFEGATLRGTKLRGCNLEGACFRAAALSATDLAGANALGADFTSAMLNKVDATKAILSRACFDMAMVIRTDLSEASLAAAHGEMAQFHKCRLIDVVADRATFDRCAFNECEMGRVSFKDANLARSFFRQCNLREACLNRCTVSNGGFFESDLTRATLLLAIGDSTNFMNSVLRETRFNHAELPRAIFRGVPARNADFGAVNMPRARFDRAALREASFDRANLFQANLCKSVLTRASFKRVNAYQALFIEAVGTDVDFSDANLELANFKRSNLVDLAGNQRT